MKATREQINDLAESVAMQAVALATWPRIDSMTDQEIRAKVALLSENVRTLEVWTADK